MLSVRCRRWRQVIGVSGAAIFGVALISAVTLKPSAAQAQDTAAAPPPLTWSGPKFVEQPPFQHGIEIGVIYKIACPKPALCVAAGTEDVVTSTRPTGGPTAWHGTKLDAHARFTALACPSPALCVAADNHHRVFFSANPAGGYRAWHSFSFDPKETIISISCPNTTLCVGYDTFDNVITANHPSRGRAAWFISRKFSELYRSMACASASLCIASGSPATYFTFQPSRGASAWHHEGTNFFALSLTCPSTSLCVGGSWNSVTFTTRPTGNGNVWSFFDFFSQGAVPAVACGGTTLCIAGSNHGELIVGRRP